MLESRILRPQCGGLVEASGIAAIGGEAWTVYQCDHCIRPWHFDDATFDVALTFALDADGNCFDPQSEETMPPLTDPSNN